MFSTRLLSAALAASLIACMPLAQAANATPDARATSATVMQIGTQSLSAQEYRALALADLPRDSNPVTAADPEVSPRFSAHDHLVVDVFGQCA